MFGWRARDHAAGKGEHDDREYDANDAGWEDAISQWLIFRAPAPPSVGRHPRTPAWPHGPLRTEVVNP